MSDTASQWMATCPRCGLHAYFEGDAKVCTDCQAAGQSLLAEADVALAGGDPTDPLDGLVNAADLEPERIEWLWTDYLPFDTVTIVDGDSTVGKSLCMINLIARMSWDETMPDGTLPAKTAVIILNKEDHWQKVTLPRLKVAGADLLSNRIYFLKGRRKLLCGTCGRADCQSRGHEGPREAGWDSVVLPADVDYLASKIEAVKAASGCDRVLFYADPLMAVIEDDVNTHNYHEMIRALEPVHRLCGDTGSAFVGIRHLTKGNQSGKAIHAGQGSTAIFSTSRMGLMIAYDPDDDNEDVNERARVLAVVGTNLARRRPSLRWRIETAPLEIADKRTGELVKTEVPTVRWLGATTITADDIAILASGDRGPGALVKTKLRAALREGPVNHGTLWATLEAETSASESTRWRTIKQEVEAGHVIKGKEPREAGKTWYSLPKDEERLRRILDEQV